MCLDIVNEVYDKPSMIIQDAWKENHGSTQHNFNYDWKGTRQIPLDRWIKAEEKVIVGQDGKSYTTGFHAYEEKPCVKQIYYRIYVRQIHTKGIQNNMQVVVAKEMYLPSNPDAWPPKG